MSLESTNGRESGSMIQTACVCFNNEGEEAAVSLEATAFYSPTEAVGLEALGFKSQSQIERKLISSEINSVYVYNTVETLFDFSEMAGHAARFQGSSWLSQQ